MNYKIKRVSIISTLTLIGFVLVQHSMSVSCCWRPEFILSAFIGLGLMINSFFIGFWYSLDILSSQPIERRISREVKD